MKRHPMFRGTLADLRDTAILLALIVAVCLSPFAIVWGLVRVVRLAWSGT